MPVTVHELFDACLAKRRECKFYGLPEPKRLTLFVPRRATGERMRVTHLLVTLSRGGRGASDRLADLVGLCGRDALPIVLGHRDRHCDRPVHRSPVALA